MRDVDVYDEVRMLYEYSSFNFRKPTVLTHNQRARKNETQRRYRERKMVERNEREAKERTQRETKLRLILVANVRCRRVAPLLCESMLMGSHDLSVEVFYDQLSNTLGHEVTPFDWGVSVIHIRRESIPALIEFLKWLGKHPHSGALIQSLRPMISYVLFDRVPPPL